MKIPKIIHQTWKDASVPVQWQKWQQSWKINHPGWDYRLWTHEDIDNFIWRWHLNYYGQFKRLPRQIMRLDVFRAFLLMSVGGVYVDLDFESLQPLDPLLENHACVIGKEPYEHATQLYGLDWIPCNAFFASVPGHPFWHHYIEQVLRAIPNGGHPLTATGPAMLRHSLDTYPQDKAPVTILEPDLLYPLPNLRNKKLVLTGRWASGGDNETACDFPGAFAVHRWQSSWLGEMNRREDGPFSGKPAVWPGASVQTAPAAPPIGEITDRLETLRSRRDYLVICRDSTHQRAISIKKATRGLFGDDMLVFPEYYSDPVYSTKELNRMMDTVIDLDFKQVVLSGFPPFYTEMVLQLKCKKPHLPVKVLYHGAPSGLAGGLAYQKNFKMLMTLAERKLVDLVGFNKRDLAGILTKLFKIRAVPYYLYTERQPLDTEKMFNRNAPDIGVLAGNEYRKNVPAQILAGLLFDQSRVHVLEGHDLHFLPEPRRVMIHPFDHDPLDFARLLSGMDINFYITFSESWGLVVSESLMQGVPCLAANSSGIFDFHPELKSFLVVDEADNPMAIYKKAQTVLENHERLKILGKEYINFLNQLAVQSRNDFLTG